MRSVTSDVVKRIIYSSPLSINVTDEECKILNSLPMEEVASLLQGMFKREKDIRMKSKIYAAILSLQTFDRVGFLLDSFKSSSLEWRLVFCEALSRFPDSRAIAKLCSVLLKDRDPDMRYTAAESLAEIGDETAISALEHALAHDTAVDYEDFPISAMAGIALQRIRDRKRRE